MRTLWKILVPLALVLPLGAYLAGALVTSVADEPAPRRTIVIHRPAPSPAPTGAVATGGPSRSVEPGDDGPPEVVTPSPEDLVDDRGDDRGDDHGADDRGDDHGGGHSGELRDGGGDDESGSHGGSGHEGGDDGGGDDG